MSIIRRAFAVGFCASIFLLGGCTTNVQQPADCRLVRMIRED